MQDLVSPVQWILEITVFWEMTPCGLVERYRISELYMNLFSPSSCLIKVICSHQFSHRAGNIPPIPKLYTLIPYIFQAVFFEMLVPLSQTIRCHILEDNNLNAHPHSGYRSSGMWCSVVLCFLVFQRIIVPSSLSIRTTSRFILKCLTKLNLT
jgi:hypothetical protein